MKAKSGQLKVEDFVLVEGRVDQLVKVSGPFTRHATMVGEVRMVIYTFRRPDGSTYDHGMGSGVKIDRLEKVGDLPDGWAIVRESRVSFTCVSPDGRLVSPNLTPGDVRDAFRAWMPRRSS